MTNNTHLEVIRLGVNTYKEAIIYLRQDCDVCKAEGFQVQARVQIQLDGKKILATLNIMEGDMLDHGKAGLSNYAWHLLSAKKGDSVSLSHPEPLTSFSHVRSKIFGNDLHGQEIGEIVADISSGRYSDIQIATFLTACAGGRLTTDEIKYLTTSMVEAGDSLSWSSPVVVDKHSVGGLPGNRTTPIVVPIVTSYGLTMPKTSSRAITSPAGTADVMEVLTKVDLDIEHMRKVVEKEGGCMVWGGSVALSPADDVLIGIERAIDLDSEGQLIASVLSKKIAAGSTHILIDIPVGLTAKVRSNQSAEFLKSLFLSVARGLNIHLQIQFSDGQQPVGNGIGPALEASDILAVLQNHQDAPLDLKEKSLAMAGHLLEFSPDVQPGLGKVLAQEILSSGKAWDKFQQICLAQGGLYEPERANYTSDIVSASDGVIVTIDNRYLSRLAKLAGAPNDKSAGIMLHKHLNEPVKKGEPLFTIHSESKGELAYAKNALVNMPNIFTLKEE